MRDAELVVVSNRGPLSFVLDEDGAPTPAGSGGGLATTLLPLLEGTQATWVACAMSDADRKAAAEGLLDGLDGLHVELVEPDPGAYRMAYDVVSNATLWFVHHHLFDAPRRPRLDRRWRQAWDAYVALNDLVAERVAAAAAPGAVVLAHDYHVSLVPGVLARRRPDLRVVHFTHTPFADPSALEALPTAAARTLLEGMAAGRACGFHTDRWRDGFVACCDAFGVAAPTTFVTPLAPDAGRLARRAGDPDVARAAERLHELVDGRRLIVRVDRIEPAKNLLRGFWAMDELLRDHPEWRGSATMLALAYRSRQSLPEYLAYGAEVELAAARVNDAWATPDWAPVILDVADDPDRSFAALQRYDVLLVNPLRDGLNLVAKEGPIANTTDGALALSRQAGAFAELAGPAIEVNPFDVAGTAEALHTGLAMSAAERRQRAAELRARATQRTPQEWLADLRRAAGE